MQIRNGFFSKKYWLYVIILAASFLILLDLSILNPLLPLSSDEAWNYLGFSRFGPIYPIFHYELPNNHVFFSILQSLTVPTFLLSYFPTATRLLNCFVGAMLFSFLYFLTNKFFKGNNLIRLGFLLMCFFISPSVTPYFLVARGTLLGMTLLIFAIYLLSAREYYLSSFILILSGWTLPTYAYTYPIIFLSAYFLADHKDRGKIISSVVIVLVGLVLCYLPVIKIMLSQTNVWGYSSLYAFFSENFMSISNLSYLPYGLIFHIFFIVGYVISMIVLFRGKFDQGLKKIILLLNSAILSYFTTVFLLAVVRSMNEPFLRNGIFVPLFIGITISSMMIVTKNRLFRISIFTLLALNMVAGIYLFVSRLPHRNQLPYPAYTGEQSYASKPLLQLLGKNKPKEITENLRMDPLINYYSTIYSIPTEESQKGTGEKLELSTQSFVIASVSSSVAPSLESNPIILPSSPLYLVKKVWQMFSLKFINFTDKTGERKIYYLLSLSDSTYAESDRLLRNGNMSMSVQTAARAENYMTNLVGSSKVVFANKKMNGIMKDRIESSLLMHRNILEKICESERNDDNTFSAVIYFFNSNSKSIQSIND